MEQESVTPKLPTSPYLNLDDQTTSRIDDQAISDYIKQLHSPENPSTPVSLSVLYSPDLVEILQSERKWMKSLYRDK